VEGAGVDQLVNYGALGIMVAVLLAFAHAQITRLVADRDKAEARSELLTAKVLDEVAPALSRATEAIKAREAHEDDVLAVLLDVRRLLERRSS